MTDEAALDDDEAARRGGGAPEEIEDWEVATTCADAAAPSAGAGEAGYAVRGRRGA